MRIPPLMRNLLAVSGAVLIAVAPVAAQEPPTEESQAIIQELQQIQDQLEQIENRAIESDASLQERAGAIEDLVLQTMIEIDPAVEQKLERLEGLRTELETAQQEQDMAKIQELVTEGQQLQQQLGEAHTEAMQNEQLVREIDEYQTQVVNKMEELEPETPTLIARARELASQLRPGGIR